MNMDISMKLKDVMPEIDNNVARAVSHTAEQALKDCNKFCKMDYGALIFSSVIHTSLEGTVQLDSDIPDKIRQAAYASPGSDLENGVLRWVMPYAAWQYGLPGTHNSKNPLACPKWCDRAYEIHGDRWKKCFINSLKEG